MIDQNTGDPYINVWFGNFFRPAYDGMEFIDRGVSVLKEDGFNSIMFDSKAWEDFRDRFAGGEASVYVRTQEYMQRQVLQEGLTYNHLLLYLNADNLYPNIRFSPPIYGESVVNADGTDGKWYRYWSDKAKESMMEHVKGIYQLYRDGFTRCATKQGDVRDVMCTMFDPFVRPSFDAEGQDRYLGWLKRKYGDIDSLNDAYQTKFTGFDALTLPDCWYECAYDEPIQDHGTFRMEDGAVRMWADNMMWKRDELSLYFEDMQRRRKEAFPSIFTCPTLTQWGYFLSVDMRDGFADYWDTSLRGVDFFRIADHVDCLHFLAVPVTPYGDPDAYVVSCQHSMMRTMNEGRDMIGGIYWGRFLYNNIYEFLTPCEMIGTIVGAGADGYASYGMCGLDDGGVLHRMPRGFHESLKAGNEWAKKVIPLIRGKRKKQVAILFPSAMSLIEPFDVDGNVQRRYDMLGYYKICGDYGYMADVIDPDMVADGRLDGYSALIIPENDCYEFDRNSAAEQRLGDWVAGGGIVVSSPGDALCGHVFGISGMPYDGVQTIYYKEGGLPQSDRFDYFTEGESVAKYYADACAGPKESDRDAVVKNQFGKGAVYSFGFAYGYSYCAKVVPNVPLSQKNHEFYPIPMMEHNIVDDIFQSIGMEKSPIRGKNVETAVFEDGMIVVNHNSTPMELPAEADVIAQLEGNGRTLPARSAAYLRFRQ